VLYLRKGRDPRLQGPGLVRGPFFLVASRVSHCLSLAEAGEPAYGQHTEVDFIVLADPKLRTRGLPEARFSAVVGQGRKLKAKTLVREPDSKARQMWHVKAMFHTPTRDERTLTKVSGTLDVIAATKSQVWEVKDVLDAKNLVKSVGRAHFAVRSIGKSESGRRTRYQVKLASWGEGETPDIGWPARSDQERMRAVRLLDAAGRAFFPRGCTHEDDTFMVTFGAEHTRGRHAEEAPANLQWELPTRVVEIQVPFEFADLPGPD